jgi:hypothetical protein
MTCSCGHCQKKKRKTFPTQVLMRRHLSTCCRRDACKVCLAYFKGNPVAKNDKKKKWRLKQKRKSTENTPCPKKKKVILDSLKLWPFIIILHVREFRRTVWSLLEAYLSIKMHPRLEILQIR